MADREYLSLDGLPLNSGALRGYVEDLDNVALWLSLGQTGLTDLSGNARNGTAQGGVTVGGAASLVPGDDASTDFDGTDDYVSTPYLTEVNYWIDPQANSVANLIALLGATLVDDTVDPYSGTVAYRATTPGVALNEGFRLADQTVAPSLSYSVGMWVRAPVGNTLKLEIQELDAASAVVGTTTTTEIAGANVYEFQKVSRTFGATGVKIRVLLRTSTTIQAVIFRADKIHIVQRNDTTVADWFQGPSTGASWDGTANASRSMRGPFVNGATRTYFGSAKRDTDTAVRVLIGGDLASGPSLQVTVVGGVQFFTDVTGAGVAAAWPAATIPVGTTFHWAFVVNPVADTASFYLNGTLVSTQAMAQSYSTPGALKIGARSTGALGAWDGAMQHVVAIEGALTVEQIRIAYRLAFGDWGFFTRSLEINPPSKRLQWLAAKNGDALGDVPGYERRTITVRIQAAGAPTMDDALEQLGALTGKLQKAERTDGGIPLTWTPAGSTFTGTFYVLAGEVTGLPLEVSGDDAGWFVKRPTVTIRLDCKPFLYGAEVTEAAVTNTDPMQIVTVSGVAGDVPAEGRLIVTDAATQNRSHVEWGSHAGTTAETSTDLLLDSDDLTITGYAGTGTTRSGAYDPGAAGNSVIRGTTSPGWVAMCSTGDQTHVGSYRIKARIWTNGAATQVRLSWRAGDAPHTSNAAVSPHVRSEWIEVDLGTIYIPTAVLGTQRWEGRVEFKDPTAGWIVDLDALWLVPSDRYGVARGPVLITTPTTFSAQDAFDQTAGVLTGKTAPTGGVWAAAGDADDFSVEVTGKTAQRIAISDVDLNTGRYAISGAAAMTSMVVQGDVKATLLGVLGLPPARWGVLARYVDINNYLIGAIDPSGGGGSGTRLVVYKRVAGTLTQLAALDAPQITSGVFHRLQLVAFASGYWALYYATASGLFEKQLSGVDSTLATGGALASGKPGLYDATGSSNPNNTRNYDNFAAWAPTDNVVIYSGRLIEHRHDDTLRQNSTGTIYGRPPSYRGSRFYLTQAGGEAKVTRVAVKTRRNDIAGSADDNIADSTTAQVKWTPRYLNAPRS